MKVVKNELEHGLFCQWSIDEVIGGYRGKINGIHDACRRMPMISRFDLDRLVMSIHDHGVLRPILVNKDRLLIDGRSRLLAVSELDKSIPDELIEVVDVDPHALAEANTTRRHLTPDQRVMSAIAVLVNRRERARQRPSGSDAGRGCVHQKVVAKNFFAEVLDSGVVQHSVERGDGQQCADLSTALSLHKFRPELASDVRQGRLNLREAISRAEFREDELQPTDKSLPSLG
tara:strand:- start:3476 stop:4168 length:693 start_codon:yes stop_codon:yes gene_type:complete